MELKEYVTLGLAGVGVAFGFGKQAAHIALLKRDIDFIGNSHREISIALNEIRDRLARIEQDISYLKN